MADSLHEQVTATKKTHILNAAAQVFAEQGFHATTIKEVARQAGVADGTIYNYFKNKEALLLGLFAQMTATASAGVHPGDLLALDLRGFLRAFVAQPLQALRGQNYEVFRVVLSEVMVNRELGAQFRVQVLEPLAAQGGAYLRAWAAQRDHPMPPDGVLVHLLSSVVLGLLVQAALGDETLEEHWPALPDLLADLLLAAPLLNGVQP